MTAVYCMARGWLTAYDISTLEPFRQSLKSLIEVFLKADKIIKVSFHVCNLSTRF